MVFKQKSYKLACLILYIMDNLELKYAANFKY